MGLITEKAASKWQDVPGYEGYYRVSKDGYVRSLRTGKTLVAHPMGRRGSEYPNVVLCVDGVRRNMPVHKLVALTFLGPCPAGKEVRHRDSDRYNPRLSNLVYGTRKENWADRHANGTALMGEAHSSAKLTARQVKRIRTYYERGWAQAKLANQFGVTQAAISAIVRRKTWKHIC